MPLKGTQNMCNQLPRLMLPRPFSSVASVALLKLHYTNSLQSSLRSKPYFTCGLQQP